ncbi:MAG: hypothetical protein IPL19_30040 [Sandaracinaceae bacterium]|nr:hypothetical protein [Sandaracinaceae bacterium]
MSFLPLSRREQRSPLRALWLAGLTTLVLASGRAEAQPAPATVEPLPAELQVAPAPGRRTVSVGGATFCAGTSVEPLRPSYLRASSLRDVISLRQVLAGREAFAFEAPGFRTMGQLACAHASEPATRDWLRAYRQLIVNQTDMDDATIDGLIAAALSTTDRQIRLPCASLQQTPSMARHEQARARLLRGICENRGVGMPDHQAIYWYDRVGGVLGPEASLPNLERLAFVENFVNARSRFDTPASLVSGSGLLDYVLSKSEFEAFDVRAALTELGRLGLTETELRVARGYLYIARARLAGALAAMERAGASDPAVAEFMGPLRTAALQRWDTETRPHTAALLRASAVEEAWLRGNRQLLTTCANDTRSAFNAYVRSRNPHSEADVRAAVAAPAGHLLAQAWRRCEHDAGHRGLADAMADLLAEYSRARGRLTFMIQSLQRTAAERSAARAGYAILPQTFNVIQDVEADDDWQSEGSGSHLSVRGVVATVQRQGDLVSVVFRRERVSVPIIECVETNRISRIDNDGVVHYERNCRVIGSELVDGQMEPVVVHSSLASGIAVGSFLEASRGSDTDTFAVPFTLRARAEGDPLSFLGITL